MNLQRLLGEHGLYLRGVTRLSTMEIETYALSGDRPGIALVGNIGSSYWAAFSRSPEYLDGAPHPLDRWSRRVAQKVADELSLLPLYPFEGPPYYPFQQWARRAESLEQSPVGVMMHPEYGLWHSYRFALLGVDVESAPAPVESPCLACVDKPCLVTCPVDAFDENGYAVERCATYLRQTPDSECHSLGCQARLACPVGPGLRYCPDQGAFHLRAFLDNFG